MRQMGWSWGPSVAGRALSLVALSSALDGPGCRPATPGRIGAPAPTPSWRQRVDCRMPTPRGTIHP